MLETSPEAKGFMDASRRLAVFREKPTLWASGPPGGSAPAEAPIRALKPLHGDPASPVRTEFTPGEMIGDFEVVRELGRGGLRIVLEAEQRSRERRVVLKVLDPRWADRPQVGVRFKVEAALAARVVHPSLVPTFSAGSVLGHEYYVEALLAESLEQSMEGSTEAHGEGHFQEIALRFAEVARGLSALHRAGILHRGIKPSNLFLSDQKILLGDFKLALNMTTSTGGKKPEDSFREEGLTRTPLYMAPEEFVHEGLDARSDVYSLGMVLYELSTGILPFPHCSVDSLARLKLTRRPIAPRRLNPQVPLGLEAVIRQAIEGNPLLRYSSAEELAHDLERFASRKRGCPRRHPSQGPEHDGDDGQQGGEEDAPDLVPIV
jgi:serine/threonine protein kinase